MVHLHSHPFCSLLNLASHEGGGASWKPLGFGKGLLGCWWGQLFRTSLAFHIFFHLELKPLVLDRAAVNQMVSAGHRPSFQLCTAKAWGFFGFLSCGFCGTIASIFQPQALGSLPTHEAERLQWQ